MMLRKWCWYLLTIYLWIIHWCNGESLVNMEDVDPREDAFTTYQLPSDERYMCSVGNGHLATNVFSTSVYMNGLYNGAKGESHRARIPAMSHIRVANLTHLSTKYTLDVKQGVFSSTYEDRDKLIIHRLYAHRFYTRAIINDFFVISKTERNVSVALIQLPGALTEDISFDPVTSLEIDNTIVYRMCGRTIQVENDKYQNKETPVCLYMSHVPTTVDAVKGGARYVYVMTADQSDAVAFKEIVNVLTLDPHLLLANHTAEWELHNSVGKITVQGDLKMSKIINGMWYYLSSSLPSVRSNQPQNQFFGLSPGGLSRGGLLQDYQGHSFWDTEIWMFPSILMFYPEIAREILEYRINNELPAKDIAFEFGQKGLRFPWESGFTGAEVTPDCCPEVVNFEQHITACIAFAIRQYFALTGDFNWMKERACSVVRGIAQFWASRVVMDPDTKLYDISGVMGPDEDHPNVTNSVFTNVIAGMSLRFGQYAACVCDEDAPTEWSSIADHLTILYDEKLDYNPQYEGYVRGTPIKQADVVLLDFPLLYKQNRSTILNNLEYYESVTRENGPAMTWSMHTIGHLRLDNLERATQLYTRSYLPYVREPFKIWTEAVEPEIGAVNFITGMGGFLQTLLFGYGGVSIFQDRVEVFNPRLPPNISSLKINKIKYLGSAIHLDISETSVWLNITQSSSQIPLVVEWEGGVKAMNDEGHLIVEILENVLYKIHPEDQTHSCTLHGE